MQLDWNNLVVICTEGGVPNQSNWHASEGVFPAETCMRHIYVGLAQDFTNVSKELLANRKTRFLCGMEAYSFFEEFYTGLRGHYHADIDPSGQARRAWNRFVAKNPENHKRIKPYMDAMFHDGALIKTAILNPFLARATLANTAVKIADMKPEDRVLVICGAETISEEIIATLGHRKRHTPNRITITHPDQPMLHKIMNKLQVRNRTKHLAIKAEIEPVRYDRVLWDYENTTNMYSAHAVFVCQPMTEEKGTTLAHINMSLYDAWHLRSLVQIGHDAKLVHLKGDPYMRGATSGIWMQSDGLDGFVSYEALYSQNAMRIDLLKRIVGKAKDAIQHIGKLRLRGDVAKELAFDTQTLELDYRLGKRPLIMPFQKRQKAAHPLAAPV